MNGAQLGDARSLTLELANARRFALSSANFQSVLVEMLRWDFNIPFLILRHRFTWFGRHQRVANVLLGEGWKVIQDWLVRASLSSASLDGDPYFYLWAVSGWVPAKQNHRGHFTVVSQRSPSICLERLDPARSAKFVSASQDELHTDSFFLNDRRRICVERRVHRSAGAGRGMSRRVVSGEAGGFGLRGRSLRKLTRPYNVLRRTWCFQSRIGGFVLVLFASSSSHSVRYGPRGSYCLEGVFGRR